jgi:hypothetical protein
MRQQRTRQSCVLIVVERGTSEEPVFADREREFQIRYCRRRNEKHEEGKDQHEEGKDEDEDGKDNDDEGWDENEEGKEDKARKVEDEETSDDKDDDTSKVVMELLNNYQLHV